MYKRLVAYKKDHNSTLVPVKYKADPQHGNWVRNQRTIYRNNKMTEERKQLLDSIGFVVPDFATKYIAEWEEMYQRLVAYKNEHKSIRVPTKYKANPKLANWVHKQRTLYRNNKMTEERKQLLDSVGFV